jgi:hypothetical protein
MRFLANLAQAAIGAAMLASLAYSTTRWPDSPIKACTGRQSVGYYCGKQGQLHTYEEFEEYQRFDTALFIGWPLGMICMVLLYRLDRKSAGTDGAKIHPRFGGR